MTPAVPDAVPPAPGPPANPRGGRASWPRLVPCLYLFCTLCPHHGYQEVSVPGSGSDAPTSGGLPDLAPPPSPATVLISSSG